MGKTKILNKSGAPKKRMGRPPGAKNLVTREFREIIGGWYPDAAMKKLWDKWLRHKNPSLAFQAFKLTAYYRYGVNDPPPVSAGEGSGNQVIIDMSAFPQRKNA